MKHPIFFTILALFLLQNNAFADSQSYSLCPNVRSYYYSDPAKNRSIVMNYDPVKKYFVFLRCGESDTAAIPRAPKKNKKLKGLSCHIYNEGTEGALCRTEITQSRVSRVISEVIDAGVSTVVYGGMSTISKVKRVINTARDLSITPQCLGTSMMKAMVLGVNSNAITNTYYEAATEIGPLTGLTRFTTRNPKAKASYIFSQIDHLLSPGGRTVEDSSERRVSLSGPSYMTAQKHNGGMDQLVLDTAEQKSLCTYMANIGKPIEEPAKGVGDQPAEPAARAMSSEPTALIDFK